MALGYIARPDEDREKAVADTLAELRYNLAEAYQDDNRHAEALEIWHELHHADPNEQRYAVHCFVSCQGWEDWTRCARLLLIWMYAAVRSRMKQ